ncbi:MAG: thioredoxin domain-containing protein [Bacillota bacterium]|jgi:uncharacterized protein YyaL (SSP411 family)
MPETQYTNRLISETSPYLLQHAHNPVDWYPWGDEAIQKAKREDKPILLSCGYSACHWCHVMERESFEDPETAGLMNRYFVNIKVDREERPDIDQIYQEAAQLMTGQGGWPLTAFLDWDGKPFFAGTYFPPQPLYGRTSFGQVLTAVHQKWTEDRQAIRRAGQEVFRHLQGREPRVEADLPALPREDRPARASRNLYRHFDREYGGFGGAPKFPNPTLLQFMAASGVLNRQPEVVTAVRFTLEQMARGGIYDQLGGGFHRYSTDRYWLAPHFEKMLYDNAQLLKLYSIGYQLDPTDEFRATALDTAAYLRRETQSPEGGFYSAQDADSEGEEGKFFVWTAAEIRQILTAPEAELVMAYYDVTERGNFAAANILNRLRLRNRKAPPVQADPALLGAARQKLFAAREKRVKPFLDRKIITGWNGLAISGLAYAYQVFGREADYQAARQAAEFIFCRQRLADGSLARIFRDGRVKVAAMLDDYTFLAQGLLDLYESDFNPIWLERSMELTGRARQRFGEPNGLYYLTAAAGNTLASRPLSRYDQAIPSGVAAQVANLLRLAALTGQIEWQLEAESILKAYSGGLEREAWSMAGMLAQLDLYRHGLRKFVFCGATPELPELLRKLRRQYIPNRIIAWTDAGPETLKQHPARELFTGRRPVGGEPTCYVCAGRQCLPPVTEWADLEGYLDWAQGNPEA